MSIDSYEIGVSLILNDQIVGTLGGVQEQFTAIQEAIKKSNDMLRDMGGLVGNLAGSSRTMASAWSKAANAAERMAAAARSVGIPAAPPFGGGGQQPPGSPPSNTMFFPSGDGGGPTGNTGFTMVDDPNQLRLGAPGAGIPMSGYNQPAEKTNWRSAFFDAAIVGDLAWHAIAKPYEAAATVDQKLAVLQAAGMAPTDAVSAYNYAMRMQAQKQYSTLSVDDLLGLEADNWRQTHNLKETQDFMPTLADSATVLTGMGYGDAAAQLFSLTRAGELGGMMNKKDQNGNLDLTQIKDFFADTVAFEQASGDAIDPAQILRLYQNLGPAAYGLSDTGRQAVLALALGLGQQKAGTGLNQMFKELVGGKMSVATESALKDANLVNTDGAVRTGQYVRLKPDSLKDGDLFQSDPVAWFMKDFAPAFQKANMGDRSTMLNAIYAASGTVQGGRVVADAIFNNPFIERYLGYAQDTPGLADSAKILANSPAGTAKGAGNALNALMVTLSNDTMSVLMPALTGVRWTANTLNDAATKHPVRAMEAEIAAAAAVVWASLKGSSVIFKGAVGKTAGLVADGGASIAGDVVTGPIGWSAAMLQAAVTASKALTDAITKAGLDGRDIDGEGGFQLGSTPSNPVYTHVLNGVPLVSTSPAMPTGPTAPNSALISRHPGQVNRLTGAP